MAKSKRGRYTLEFKQEAVRLVSRGRAKRQLHAAWEWWSETLFNWVSKHRSGSLRGASSKAEVTAEQMENIRLRAELARVTMTRRIGKSDGVLQKVQK